MFLFLEKSTSQKQRTPIKYHPEKTFGNSYESPSEFQGKYSIVNDQSYYNPFLKYGSNAECLSARRESRSVDPKWTHKVNFSNI